MRDIIKHSINSIETSTFFVLKKNEKLRLCVDYRNLNKITRKNRHFLSLIIQMLNQLKDCRFFIKIDLTETYNRIRIKKNDEWKTTFRIRLAMIRFRTESNRKLRNQIIEISIRFDFCRFEIDRNRRKDNTKSDSWSSLRCEANIYIYIYACVVRSMRARWKKIFFAKIIELNRSFSKLFEFCKSNENWAQLQALKLRQMLKLFAT
jgi:hypothetical protein